MSVTPGINVQTVAPLFFQMLVPELNHMFVCVCWQSGANMPVRQLFKPASIPGLAHDHSYGKMSMEEDFLHNARVTDITTEEVAEIEKETRGQATSRKWHETRTYRLTASRFGEICKSTERRNKQALADSYTVIKDLNAPALRHGRKYESVAVEQYELQTQSKTLPCGIFVSQEHPFLAASPDRIVDDHTLIEVKCPFSAKDRHISHVTVPYLKVSPSDPASGLMLDHNHQYFYQIQGQMFCSGRRQCYLVVYTLKDMKVVEVKYDQAFVHQMVEKLKSFYEEYFRNAVINTHFFKFYNNFYC